MKDTTTTHYCDATGDKIEDLYEMLVVTLHKSAQALENPETQLQLSQEAHGLEYDRIIDHTYDAYLGEDGTIAMIEETDTTGPTYYGRNTSDEEMARLARTLDMAVSVETDGSSDK